MNNLRSRLRWSNLVADMCFYSQHERAPISLCIHDMLGTSFRLGEMKLNHKEEISILIKSFYKLEYTVVFVIEFSTIKMLEIF